MADLGDTCSYPIDYRLDGGLKLHHSFISQHVSCNYFLFHHLDRGDTVDVIYPLLFTSRLNSMHTIISLYSPPQFCSGLSSCYSLSLSFLLSYPFLVHIEYEVNVPLRSFVATCVFFYVPDNLR
jgi:hypothetical protein